MIGKQAKVLSDKHINSLLVFARRTRYPSRNRVIVLLSVKAGLRAGEIANLTWGMVLDPSGQIGSIISLESRIAKKGSARLLPLHSDLRRALARLHREETGEPIVRSERGGSMTPIAVVNWFGTAYRELGLKGCSSHSGRPSRLRATMGISRARQRGKRLRCTSPNQLGCHHRRTDLALQYCTLAIYLN